MYSELLDQLMTVDDVEKLKNEVEILRSAVFKLGKKNEDAFEQTLKNDVRTWVAEAIRKILADQTVDKQKFLQDLSEELKKLKPVQITLASQPSQALLEKMHDWLNVQVHPGILLDIQYEPAILGGMVIAADGKYHDFSLRKKTLEVLEKTNI